MKLFIKSKPFKVLALLLALVLAGSVLAVATNDSVSPISVVFGTVLKPVQSLAGKAANKFNLAGKSFQSSKVLNSEVERLKEQIRQYEKQLADFDEMQERLKSYEDILELKDEHNDFELSYVNIIGSDTSDSFGSFIIDKGTSDGVEVNCPVVSGKSLVGVVKKCNRSYSIVQTLLNPSISVAAMESKTRESSFVGTTVQMSRQGKCIMFDLSQTTDISPGGIIETSGIGGVFPKGLVIGTVSQVLESEYDVTDYAIITPSADYDNLENIFVITSFNGQGVAVVE